MIRNPSTKGTATLPIAGQFHELSDGAFKDLEKVFKLLADEMRLRILMYLAQTDELHVQAICKLLRQSQPAVSHHLALLRDAELIEPRREGKHNFYRLTPGRFQAVLELLFAATPHNERRAFFDEYLHH